VHLDPAIPQVVAIVFALAVLSIVAKVFRQPAVVGYILAGLIVGPAVLGLFTDMDLISRLGSFGVILLLFLVGLEVAPREIARNWRIAILGTSLQIGLTTLFVIVVGQFLDWPIGRSVLMGFVFALSSTAVVVKMFEDSGELQSATGQDVLSILLVQDLAVIPMLIIIQQLAGGPVAGEVVVLQVFGAVVLVALTYFAVSRPGLSFPYADKIRHDYEIQVLIALLICFGAALFSGLMELSSALGAFVAGIIVRSLRDMNWAEERVHSFGVVLVALFFVSVGMLIDLKFLKEHWLLVLSLTVVVTLGNTALTALVLRFLGRRWKNAIYGGAALSQIGEFSFVLAAVGLSANVIENFGYQLTIAVIALSLLISPIWIAIVRRLVQPELVRTL
jgi:K+:H+ antiporter